MLQLGELADLADSFEDRGAQVIALAKQTIADARSSAEKARAEQREAGGQAAFPIAVLADADGAVARLYDVANWDSAGGDRPAVFIIDESGTIVWEYLSTDNEDRPSARQILQNLP